MAVPKIPTMTSSWLAGIVLLLYLVNFSTAQSVPKIIDYSAINNRTITESVGVGYFLGKIIATGDSKLTYDLQGDGGEYFSIDKDNGNVTVKKTVDYEAEHEIRTRLVVTDLSGLFSTAEGTIFVNDVNDNPPKFTDTAIYRSLPEDLTVNTTVTPITVNDVDTVNSLITVICDTSTPLFQDACDTFRLVVTENSNKYWRGYLVLSKALDYETRISYIVRLIASDGKYSVTNDVHMEVTDVNDTPPKWDYVGPKTIPEEQPIGTSVQQVRATDGDLSAPREIFYELYGPNIGVFKIDNSTGNISNAIRLDYDNSSEHEKGVPYDINVRAREIINKTTGLLGNDSLTTATISLKITVEDINDNGPVFNQQNYIAYVDENTVSLTNIPGLLMTVTDIDSATYNSFNLQLLNYTDVFGIIPLSASGTASASIYVKDGSKLDYESGTRQYIITVLAPQNFINNKMFTGSATVTINVQDVNDITPVFPQNTYSTRVSETAPSGTYVITVTANDPEEGPYGSAGIRYMLFGDNLYSNFKIDPVTGVVSVSDCNPPNQPGVTPCIDYERKQNYSLTVSATDDLGLGRTISVPLFIQIIDENDNPPRIDSKYVRYIQEDQTVTINPLVIEPIDPDTVGGNFTYEIVGDASNLWIVTNVWDPYTRNLDGNITAIRKIKYMDARYPDGQFNFAVTVRDDKYSITALVQIIVIDINDNAPQFIPSSFDISIPETTPGGTFVIQVTAKDNDAPTTGNGVIDFSIESGALGKFTVANVTLVSGEFRADIVTTKDATFNYETQNLYTMRLIARDRGSPQSLSGEATLIVRIIDANNKDPVIQPSFQSVNVYENTLPGTSVYQVTANDPDLDHVLRYYMTAVQATDGAGNNISSSNYDFTKLFRIDETNGDVYVNSSLDRDKTSRITYDLLVTDIKANPIQSGRGTLLIHILEFNTQAPYFVPATYNVSISEELNRNSFVLNLNCQDSDDTIAGYSIKQDSPRSPIFFSLLPGAGAMIVSGRIDYEALANSVILLTATCTDAGQPALTATTSIIVNVTNINDNTPIFSQSIYQTTIPENTQGGTLNITVNATDADKDDYGVVRYALNDPYGFFAIDNVTGVITILPNATFDSEKVSFLTFQVIAYDSPLDPSVRKSASVPVQVTISDVDDNCPVFSQQSYQRNVPESTPVDSDILQIFITDADVKLPPHTPFIKSGSGNPPEAESLFGIRAYGFIYVKSNLKGKLQTYTFNVSVTDVLSSGYICPAEVPVTIVVQRSDNSAPQWIRPPNRDFVIHVLESQYDGLLVYSAKALDNDTGPNGVVDYYFSTGDNVLVSATPEFRINNVTGVIRAEIVFDREQVDRYFLTLVAKDKGRPASSSQTTIVVLISDVNDNEPKFPMKDGIVIPKVLTPVPENMQIAPNGTLVGSCNATDADSDVENNIIYYRLLAAKNNVSNYIRVNNITCEIYLIKLVDFETTRSLEFNILAYNIFNDDTVKRAKREVNPSILPVSLSIIDINDNPPAFTQTSYLACVSSDAPYQQDILQVSAVDKDIGDNNQIAFSLNGTMAFQIDRDIGTITNIISFYDSSSSGQQIYHFNVQASDGVNSTSVPVTIFVTSTSNIATLKVNRPLSDVVPFKQQIINLLKDSSNGQIAFACVDDVRTHVDSSGQQSYAATDVLVSAFKNVNGQYTAYSASELVDLVDKERLADGSSFNAIYVTDVKEEGADDSSILKEDAVLAIFIICILLIFLAIILLCIACICIRNSDRRKKKNIKAASHTIVHVQEPLQTSVNPVYDRGHASVDETVEYSTVKKVHLTPTAASPVIVPAPLITVDDVPPLEPPRAYLDEPEPVIETFVEPDPVTETYFEPEPVIKTYLEPEPVIETYLEPEPVIETYIEPEPVIETYIESERQTTPEPIHVTRHYEPEYENTVDHNVGHYEPGVSHHVSFPDPIEEDEIEASIRDSPVPSELSSNRDSPIPSPPSSIRHQVEPDYDSD